MAIFMAHICAVSYVLQYLTLMSVAHHLCGSIHTCSTTLRTDSDGVWHAIPNPDNWLST